MSRLFSWLLNGVYLTLMLVALPWIVGSAVRHGKYRAGFSQKLLGRVPRRQGLQPCVWLHAVSVGEVNLLQTTLGALQQSRPDWEFVISTTTRAGYELACRKYSELPVFYCPLDFSWAVHAAMRRIRPDLLVLAELELWPNLIWAARRQGAQVAIINGRLSDPSFRGYGRIRPWVASVLGQLSLIAAQNEETAGRFRQLGAERVTVTGSLKFDGARTDRSNRQTQNLRKLASLHDRDTVFLAGSTQAPEERYAIEIYRTLSVKYPQLRLILVPRHPERFEEVAQLLDRSGLRWVRRSQLPAAANDGVAHGDADVDTHVDTHGDTVVDSRAILLVDSVGELGAWWGAATIGFVGGSFGSRGGQNMLEPAAFGVATCFGPNTRNFRDIVGQLLAARGGETVSDCDQLEKFVGRALEDPAWARQLGKRASELVLAQQGATARTVELLLPLVDCQKTALRRQQPEAA